MVGKLPLRGRGRMPTRNTCFAVLSGSEKAHTPEPGLAAPRTVFCVVSDGIGERWCGWDGGPRRKPHANGPLFRMGQNIDPSAHPAEPDNGRALVARKRGHVTTARVRPRVAANRNRRQYTYPRALADLRSGFLRQESNSASDCYRCLLVQ
jgi:hypothetical protein